MPQRYVLKCLTQSA